MQLLNGLFVGVDRFLARWQPAGFQLRQLRAREKYRPDYEIVAASLLSNLQFDSVLDVGCANGFLLEAFWRAGREVAGVDRAPDIVNVLPPALQHRVQVVDFSQAQGRYDLVCCVEVAEHLPPARSEELVDKLSGLARSWIYFSAAPPGQIGLGHVNSRPHADWLAWFARRNWILEETLTSKLRGDLKALRKTYWLKRNSFILAPRVPIEARTAASA